MNLHCDTSLNKPYLHNIPSYGVAFLFLSMFIVHCTVAQWSTTTDTSLLVSPWGVAFDACSDSAGGAYTVLAYIGSVKSRFYLQRIRHDGSLQWQDPIMLSDTAYLQKPCSVINDGFGNAIAILIAKTPYDTIENKVFYNGKVFVQKVDVKGNKLWGANGLRVSLDTMDQYGYRGPFIVPDDSGGVFALWQNKPRELIQPVTDIFVQHITHDGRRAFGDSAKPIASITLLRVEPTITKANSSVIVSFGSDTNSTLERIDRNGNILWTTNIPHWVSNVTQINNLSFMAIAEKHSGYDNYITSYIAYNLDIATGQSNWQNVVADSIHVPGDVSVSGIVSVLIRKDSNIAIIHSFGTNIGYMQLLSPTGNSLFGKNGKAITDTTTGTHSYPVGGVNSTNNSVIVLFSNTSDNRYYKYYAQKLYSDGSLLWTGNGSLFSNEFLDNTPVEYIETIPDGSNGIIAIGNCEPYFKIFAKQMNYAGVIGDITTNIKTTNATKLPQAFGLWQNYPNPFNPVTTINYQVPPNPTVQRGNGVSAPRGIHVSLKVYDVLGREAATLVDEVKKAGSYSVHFNASRFPTGIYFYRLQSGSFVATKKMVLVK